MIYDICLGGEVRINGNWYNSSRDIPDDLLKECIEDVQDRICDLKDEEDYFKSEHKRRIKEKGGEKP